MKMKGAAPQPGAPGLSERELNYVMHVALPISGGTLIMGTDMLESMGHKLVVGNNTTINLDCDARDEADRLFHALSAGGSDMMPRSEKFRGYRGCCPDCFGVRWMFNVANPSIG